MEVETLSSTRADYYDKLDPYPSTCADRNVAKREYAVEADAQLAGSERTLPFVLVATLGRHRSQVTFEVTGSISVKRPY